MQRYGKNEIGFAEMITEGGLLYQGLETGQSGKRLGEFQRQNERRNRRLVCAEGAGTGKEVGVLEAVTAEMVGALGKGQAAAWTPGLPQDVDITPAVRTQKRRLG